MLLVVLVCLSVCLSLSNFTLSVIHFMGRIRSVTIKNLLTFGGDLGLR